MSEVHVSQVRNHTPSLPDAKPPEPENTRGTPRANRPSGKKQRPERPLNTSPTRESAWCGARGSWVLAFANGMPAARVVGGTRWSGNNHFNRCGNGAGRRIKTLDGPGGGAWGVFASGPPRDESRGPVNGTGRGSSGVGVITSYEYACHQLVSRAVLPLSRAARQIYRCILSVPVSNPPPADRGRSEIPSTAPTCSRGKAQKVKPQKKVRLAQSLAERSG